MTRCKSILFLLIYGHQSLPGSEEEEEEDTVASALVYPPEDIVTGKHPWVAVRMMSNLVIALVAVVQAPAPAPPHHLTGTGTGAGAPSRVFTSSHQAACVWPPNASHIECDMDLGRSAAGMPPSWVKPFWLEV
jgi:hypothetical protein